MGVKNISKKATKRVGRAFGLSDVNDKLTILEKGFYEHFEELSNRVRYLEQQNADLKNFIVANADIEKAPAAKGYSRLMQLANLKLLVLVKEICEKNNIEFYLNFGSLLGAVRHKGFIPWDDDVDIMMAREDYNRFLKIITELFDGTKLFFVHSEIIRIFYGDTPCQIDVFPSDFCSRPVEDEVDRKKLSDKIQKIHTEKLVFDWGKLYTRERTLLNLSYDEVEALRIKTFGPDISKQDAKKIRPAIHHSIEKGFSGINGAVQDYDWVYPLRKTSFEGVQMPIPNRPDFLLDRYYGDYMLWPNDIAHKHDDIQSRLNNDTIITLKKIINSEIDLLEKVK